MKKIECGMRIHLALTVPESVAPSSWNWCLNFVAQKGSNALCVVKSQNGMVKIEFFTIYKILFEIFAHYPIVLTLINSFELFLPNIVV